LIAFFLSCGIEINFNACLNDLQIFKNHNITCFVPVDADYYNDQEGRFALSGLGANLLNIGLFNNRFNPRWRPFANLASSLEACTSPSGDAGICTPGSVCSLFSGRPSGSCTQGKVCCVSKSKNSTLFLFDNVSLIIDRISNRCSQQLWRYGDFEQHVLAIFLYSG
jgi:hypothetical protein